MSREWWVLSRNRVLKHARHSIGKPPIGQEQPRVYLTRFTHHTLPTPNLQSRTVGWDKLAEAEGGPSKADVRSIHTVS